jgi:hypothetical protein
MPEHAGTNRLAKQENTPPAGSETEKATAVEYGVPYSTNQVETSVNHACPPIKVVEPAKPFVGKKSPYCVSVIVLLACIAYSGLKVDRL